MLSRLLEPIANRASRPVTIYPYEFPTSGYANIDQVRSLIEDQTEWDYCFDAELASQNNENAAAMFGYIPPFTTEQTALGELLKELNTGLHIMTYAWGLYADIPTDK